MSNLELLLARLKKRKIKILLDKYDFANIENLESLILKLARGHYETYYGNGNLQCEEDKFRSLDEIFICCKSHFPNVSDVEILTKISELLKHRRILSFFCSDIKKQVTDYPFTHYNYGKEYPNGISKSEGKQDKLFVSVIKELQKTIPDKVV